MGTNGTDSGAHLMYEEESLGIETIDRSRDQVEHSNGFTFDPLVNRIALSIARELTAAIKELEYQVDSEVRKLGEAVERRLDSFQVDLRELSRFTEEQRANNGGVQDQLQQLAAAHAELRETDTRQSGELEAIRTEARDLSAAISGRFDSTLAALQESEARHAADLAALQDSTNASFQPVWDRIDSLCRDFGFHTEDSATTKTTLGAVCSRVDAFVERLDRQADAVRSLHSAWSQRDSELDQIVDGLARLRAHASPQIANEL